MADKDLHYNNESASVKNMYSSMNPDPDMSIFSLKKNYIIEKLDSKSLCSQVFRSETRSSRHLDQLVQGHHLRGRLHFPRLAFDKFGLVLAFVAVVKLQVLLIVVVIKVKKICLRLLINVSISKVVNIVGHMFL